jgi:hypothetical protein
MKSFWKSRNLFSKRFLAAGGKVAVDFGNHDRLKNLNLSFIIGFNYSFINGEKY